VTTLVLCRHAEAGNAAQAHVLAASLAALAPAAVYTSPLARAVETAVAIAALHGLTPVKVDGLREIDFGEADGLAFDELPHALQRELLDEPASVKFPGGESYVELQERVCSALARIVADHPDRTVVVVSHVGSIRAALAAWLSIPGEASFRIDQRHAAVNVVDWHEGVPLVRLVNGTGLS
jgi:broad specificity phosphatase PhoE